MRGDITLNDREQRRLLILNKVNEGELTAAKAAQLLARSLRQVRRLLRRYRKRGAAALIHGNRGRPPVHVIKSRLRKRVVHLASTTYKGFNQQHFTELLAEREGIVLSRSSVRRFLSGAGIVSPRRRRSPQHRSRRERYAQEGMLVQIDGSSHRWFGRSHPRATLFAAIDDATGRVLDARFGRHEDAQGYIQLTRSIVDRLGRPLAIYRDRHGVFQVNQRRQPTVDEQLRGEPDLTQFGRVLKELDIESKPSYSPQAKGRIERLFGTFQDRLVNEMRLNSIQTIAEANAWLPQFLSRYNRRFTVQARIAGTVYRPLPPSIDPETIFCFKYTRTVNSDNVVRLGSYRLQILADRHRTSYVRARVEIQQRMDGALAVYYRGRCLASSPAPAEAPILRALGGRGSPKPQQHVPDPLPSTAEAVRPEISTFKPAPTHPWRRTYKNMKPKNDMDKENVLVVDEHLGVTYSLNS
jgi:transposase